MEVRPTGQGVPIALLLPATAPLVVAIARIAAKHGARQPWLIAVTVVAVIVVVTSAMAAIHRRRVALRVDGSTFGPRGWRARAYPLGAITRAIDVHELVLTNNAKPRRWVFVMAFDKCLWRANASAWADTDLDLILGLLPVAAERWDGKTDLVTVRNRMPDALPWLAARAYRKWIVIAVIVTASLIAALPFG